MSPRIRALHAGERERVVELAVRIWEPVFASVNATVGPELAVLLHGQDWREHQAADTRRLLETDGVTSNAWVAELDERIVGFCAAAVVDPARSIGEVQIVGVEPEAQQTGIGRTLVEVATGWLQERGMRVAYISTGGDAGHAPARRLYERLGFTLFPSAQYFQVLAPEAAPDV
jgi:GNAT superfamily N-acetyltransferase